MRYRKNIIIVVSIVLFCSILGLWFLREASFGLRIYKTDDNLRSLSMYIENFRTIEDHYPQTLSELLTNDYEDESGEKALQDLIKEIQHNPWHDNYDYQPSTNGFTIIVTGPETAPAGWFGKQRKVERHYNIGEAVKELNIQIRIDQPKDKTATNSTGLPK
jgi:hypothetical protein